MGTATITMTTRMYNTTSVLHAGVHERAIHDPVGFSNLGQDTKKMHAHTDDCMQVTLVLLSTNDPFEHNIMFPNLKMPDILKTQHHRTKKP